MKLVKILLFFFFVTSLSLKAEVITGSKSFDSYQLAQEAKDHLKFTVESTKVGIFSSDVDGFVLRYNYKADYDEKNGVLKDLELVFLIKDMNTDHQGRDTKLHTQCMGMPEFQSINVLFNGPIFIKDKKPQKLAGIVVMRGKEKPFIMMASLNFLEKTLSVSGQSVWSLKEMEIPDPSIAVAKLSDEIRLDIKLTHIFK
ncbi:MAG: hypothetical protein K9K67_15790 [Bacteriovoracaceae bacterium]|nr:hypothetical protein [Bacteriovoracaceae bacterium]